MYENPGGEGNFMFVLRFRLCSLKKREKILCLTAFDVRGVIAEAFIYGKLTIRITVAHVPYRKITGVFLTKFIYRAFKIALSRSAKINLLN